MEKSDTSPTMTVEKMKSVDTNPLIEQQKSEGIYENTVSNNFDNTELMETTPMKEDPVITTDQSQPLDDTIDLDES